MLTETSEYITSNIADNELFIKTDIETQERSMKEAETQIKMHYGNIEIPTEALAYQTLWILAADDTVKKGEQGVGSVSVNGISVSIKSPRSLLSPFVFKILGRKKGMYVL